MLAYAGEGKWIQADPEIGSVFTQDERSGDSFWFDTPISVHRWQMLEDL